MYSVIVCTYNLQSIKDVRVMPLLVTMNLNVLLMLLSVLNLINGERENNVTHPSGNLRIGRITKESLGK